MHNTDDCKVLKAQASQMSAQLIAKRNAKPKGKSKFPSDSKAFQLYTAEIVEKVFKKMKKNHKEQKSNKALSFSRFKEMSVSSDSDNK